jgi:hypothetical protein
MEHRLARLLSLAATLQQRVYDGTPVVGVLTRPFLGAMLSQSAQVEELLDAFGARRNREWRPLRGLVATTKLFSDVHYILLHILHALPSYSLRSYASQLAEATNETLTFTGNAIYRVAEQLLAEAKQRELSEPQTLSSLDCDWTEGLPEGMLEPNRVVRKARSARETVVQLATAYLSLAAQSEFLHDSPATDSSSYADRIPDPINETELRHSEQRFHNLQALYDTHVSFTDVEAGDPDLVTLRGQITVVYHLLETATKFCHYYERHVARVATLSYVEVPSEEESLAPLVHAPQLLAVLMEYSLAHAGKALKEGRDVCQAMLHRYSERGSVTVTAPRYRGFHVRPSTLIAKIVRHYGTSVAMRMGNASYDAGSPLELFRANEQINARKRRWFAEEIGDLLSRRNHIQADSLVTEVRRIIMALAEQGKVVIYQQPLPVEMEGNEDYEQRSIIEEVARLQGLGKIDIQADIQVEFEGDTRVVRDIALLAEGGYGEDNFGNNIALPAGLSYLRR